MSIPMRWEQACIDSTVLEQEAERQAAQPRTHGRQRTVRLALVTLFLAGCIAAGGYTLNVVHGLRGSSALRLQQLAPHGGAAMLNSATAERRLGYVTVTGSVTNHSTKPLSKVEAVVELLDANGHTVGIESALLAFDPLNAGDTAPFHVEAADNPAATAYRVRFRQVMGPAVD